MTEGTTPSRDEILAIAWRAGLWDNEVQVTVGYTDAVVRFFRLAQAAAYERAAQLCESTYPTLVGGEEILFPCFDDGNDCAVAIRALKEGA